MVTSLLVMKKKRLRRFYYVLLQLAPRFAIKRYTISK
ncbi:hypothetical protein MGSAQ_001303 [marine sediment metagenome]|uniref:Uncharacterized protein n=1 Tax=marine sediment metagenome TaxID=412755 RepID=A0A1B6NUS5_9ZZZZ